MPEPVWVFGYGSLIWKVDFPFLQRQRASIFGWQRRFWQGSHDHRGTPNNPGRVLTLEPKSERKCEGMAYLVASDVFEHLDHREKNGYERFDVELFFQQGGGANGTVYIATENNHAFLGAAPLPDIAAHIARSCGPSGLNSDYLLELAAALRELNIEDLHVFELSRLVSEQLAAQELSS
jgi:cation transport regulator ChaC